MDRLKDILAYFFAAMAMFALLCSIYEAMNQRLGSASLLAGIFAAAALLVYLPQMETFKAFGVEAKLQQKLDRAEEIISKMKNLAAIDAKATYALLAWGNRLSGIPMSEKQNISDRIDLQLKSFGFDEEEAKDIKAEYIYLIGFDLGSYFEQALSMYVIRAIGSDAARSDELKAWSKEWNANGRLTLEKLKGLTGAELARALKAEMPRNKMKAEDTQKFEAFADKVSGVYSGCLERKGYTAEAINFFDEFQALAGDALVARVLK
jgi:hypothetical protein